jgi:large conductance mechanosensitive channel
VIVAQQRACHLGGIHDMSLPAPTPAPKPVKKGLWTEFKEFLNQGDFVTIAVGLIFALYVKAIVDAIIAGIIKPIIAAIFGEQNFNDIGFSINDAFFSIGLVIGALIDFVVIGLILFLLIKGWNALRRTADQPEVETELSVLREIREELRQRT